jgi:molecular chaperone GrpE (heat shock protein)
MSEVSDWKISKWPFFTANAVLIFVPAALIAKSAHPISAGHMGIATACVALGTVLGCLPFILEYRAVKKLVEVNAVTGVAGQLQDLKTCSAQIAAAAEQWAFVQDATKGNAEKTTAAAREISERMAKEVREFNEFQGKLNDSEKAALRLEADKLRRVEGEWLQVVARILDHVFALHNAATRSGQPELADQIGNFQHVCHDTARRVGLVPFGATVGEKFDGQKHRAHGVENPPADAVIAEFLAPGLSFQGRMLRPVLVRLNEPNAPAAVAEVSSEKPATDGSAPEELTLEAD